MARSTLIILGVIFSSACTRSNPPLTPALEELARRQDLAIILLLASTNQEALTLDWKSAGHLKLSGAPMTQDLSPDGSCLAWLSLSSIPVVNGGAGKPVAFITDAPGSKKEIKINAGGASVISASARCDRLALIVEDSNFSLRLIVIDSATGGSELDLTPLIPSFNLAKARRIQLSAAGTRLAIGSEEDFAVLDIPKLRTIAQGKGRYASLAPDGATLAFVDPAETLSLLSLESQERRKLLAGYPAREVGPWSPDGRFLMASVARLRPLSAERMVVVDTIGDSYLPLEDLGDDSPGPSMYGWITRSLLVP
ncbi:MAG TPA: hypothetical protein VGG72_01750 [Bryobacteraceae bacterium]|jgi:hypothetical protein